jgi:hypothetical protein
VKKVLLFLLALQVVSAGYLPAELIKVGNLYRHFMEHRESGGNIGLLQFVRLHYFDAKHQASDPLTHETLPLQQSAGHLLTIVFQSPSEPIHITGYSDLAAVHMSLPPAMALPDGPPGLIFQPPRHA